MKSPEELLAQAEELEARGDEHVALAVWRELVALRPDPVALCRFAGLARELNNQDEAESALRRAVKLDPSLSEAYLALGPSPGIVASIKRGRTCRLARVRSALARPHALPTLRGTSVISGRLIA